MSLWPRTSMCISGSWFPNLIKYMAKSIWANREIRFFPGTGTDNATKRYLSQVCVSNSLGKASSAPASLRPCAQSQVFKKKYGLNSRGLQSPVLDPNKHPQVDLACNQHSRFSDPPLVLNLIKCYFTGKAFSRVEAVTNAKAWWKGRWGWETPD